MHSSQYTALAQWADDFGWTIDGFRRIACAVENADRFIVTFAGASPANRRAKVTIGRDDAPRTFHGKEMSIDWSATR